jgi:hypothetical protein
MMLVEKLLPARVMRVYSANRVELDIDLGFGVRVARSFHLDGIDPKTIPDAAARDAVHALVVLIGGKQVLVRPEHTRSDARRASVYLNERIFGTPVGFVGEAPGLPRAILDVAVFFNWIAAQSFNVALVREVVHGKKATTTEGD